MTTPDHILHITTPAAWAAAQAAGSYRSLTLDSEGFIHCSTTDQLHATANRHYAGQGGLLVLVLDPTRLSAPLRWEAARNGELYPHIYGPINPDAVVATRPLEPDAKGHFVAPVDTDVV